MSKVYDKAKNSQFSSNFENQSAFESRFGQYCIQNSVISPPKIKPKFYGFDKGGGIPLCKCENCDTVSIDQSDVHTLVIGPTGSKKTRLVVMPTVKILSTAGESMIVVDPKAEIYRRSSKELSDRGYRVFILNLRMLNQGASWNPLSIPFRFFCNGEIDRACEFTNDISENLTHLDASEKDPFWDNSAGALFFGLAILLFKYCKEFNEPESSVHIGNIIQLRNLLFLGDLKNIRNKPIWNYIKNDVILSSALSGTMEAPNDTRQSILSVFDQKMQIFRTQPSLINLLSTNEINFDSINDTPTAIFLILPDEKTSYHKIVSLFIKQSYEYIIYRIQAITDENSYKQKIRLNYIIDEFSSLPTIRDFPAMITAARSRNIRFTIIIQSKHQLMLRYSEETDTIISNCGNWIFLTSRELKLLEEISALCGNCQSSNGIQPLLSVAELQRLDKERGEALVLSGRMYPLISSLLDIDMYGTAMIEDDFKLSDHRIETAPIILFEKFFDQDQKNCLKPTTATHKADEDSEITKLIQNAIQARLEDVDEAKSLIDMFAPSSDQQIEEILKREEEET